MEDIEPERISIPVENSKLKIKDATLDLNVPIKKSKFLLSKITKIGVLVLILICITLAVVLTILYLTKGETKVQEYRETQYNLLVNSEIKVVSGTKSSTTFDNFNVIFFALDMIGDKYRILLTKGSIEENSSNFSSIPMKPEFFIYLELESRTGKVLEAKYKKDFYDDYSINMLIGITQVFVVDQDSEWEYSSQCKKTGTKSNQCTHNSKKKDGSYVMFQRKQNSEDRLENDNAEFEHTSTTWVDSDGKVEKSQIGGWFSKVVDNESNEKVNFNVSASVVILSTSKISRDNLNNLNDIVDALPLENKPINSIGLQAGEYEEIETPPDSDDDGEHENLIELNERMLASDNERMLFDNEVKSKYFSFYSIPFYFNTRIYSKTDLKGQVWLCGIHYFEFGGINLKLLKKDFCLSSHKAKISSKKKISDLAREGSQEIFLYKQSFSIFTFSVYGKVKVNNTPYLETYTSEAGKVVTNVEVQTKISVSVTGEASVGIAKGGMTFENSMKSIIDDYMAGYQSPFAAGVSLDKSLDATFEIWVKYLTIGIKCYNFFGLKICLPTIKYSSKISLHKETFDYKYYPRAFIFTKSF